MKTASNLNHFASKLYRCKVMHQRLLPKGYFFKHNVFMLYLDLDELDQLDRALPLFSLNRFNLFSFYDQDHLFAAAGKTATLPGLKDRLLRYLYEHDQISSAEGEKFQGKIFLLTYPRILGYVFNPVSFYFIFDQQQKPLAAVAEVGNTFAEMKMYLLSGANFKSGNIFDLKVAKYFYVSPFSHVADYFHFVLPLPTDKINLSVDTLRASGEKLLVTNVNGQKYSIADLNFVLFLQYPLLTLKVIASIHFHALRLWLAKIPFFSKQDSAELQIDVLHRHEKENNHVRVESRY